MVKRGFKVETLEMSFEEGLGEAIEMLKDEATKKLNR